MVGIKTADGKFYPVLDETERKAKKVVLTTIRDEQTNVQINLYRGNDGGSGDSLQYIASLVLESIPAGKKGSADIELSLSLDSEMNLTALAKETASGEYQSLRINIECLEGGDFSFPDIDFESEEAEAETAESPSVEESGPAMVYSEYSKPPEEEGGDFAAPHPASMTAFLVFGFVILSVLMYIFFNIMKGSPLSPLEACLPFFPAARTKFGDKAKNKSLSS